VDPVSDILTSFVDASRDYCALIDSVPALPVRTFLEQVQRVLTRIYALALELPSVAPDTADEPPDHMTHQDWLGYYRRLGDYLGTADLYWMVFDPTDADDHDAIASTLSDDLSDIYRGLAAFLADAAPTPNRDAVWSVRFNFEIHWGHHVVAALTAIHALLYGPHALTD
jgi:hypothetical protein